ncbi:hypothetical protein NDU88_006485 [Pleurodeles waltl]|uniref:Uncharacterized protein n=1 Tax=Pleurodeles waltl TaxID=8319 RepID=A0AAV7UPU8_PLEWA|nr:hypothetical protein NDU88_006485 [Pleurodeles waltl]
MTGPPGPFSMPVSPLCSCLLQQCRPFGPASPNPSLRWERTQVLRLSNGLSSVDLPHLSGPLPCRYQCVSLSARAPSPAGLMLYTGLPTGETASRRADNARWGPAVSVPRFWLAGAFSPKGPDL